MDLPALGSDHEELHAMDLPPDHPDADLEHHDMDLPSTADLPDHRDMDLPSVPAHRDTKAYASLLTIEEDEWLLESDVEDLPAVDIAEGEGSESIVCVNETEEGWQEAENVSLKQELARLQEQLFTAHEECRAAAAENERLTTRDEQFQARDAALRTQVGLSTQADTGKYMEHINILNEEKIALTKECILYLYIYIYNICLSVYVVYTGVGFALWAY